MATHSSGASAESLPDYIQAAQPNPPSNRAPWYKNTAPTYAGIFLWFVFWDSMASNGLKTGGLWITLLGVLLGGLISHFLFYLVPGLLGMKTGLPLYIVGTSTFGSIGGFLLPGFLMGVLQFGWIGVNTYASSDYLDQSFNPGLKPGEHTQLFFILCVLWALGAAFIGLKGIQYVAKVATFLPLIPMAVLVFALVKYGGSAREFRPTPSEDETHDMVMAMLTMAGAIVGFFATAGAAGVDFGMNNRDARDVNLGGIFGIVVAVLFTAGGAVVAVAGAQALGILGETGKVTDAFKIDVKPNNEKLYQAIMIGLTVAAFPGACFSSFIAANSFKTVMPRVNSYLSVGLGAMASIALAISGWAGDLTAVFLIIGASFGPICGAMFMDYLLSGRKWPGPRAGFNPAGWVAWLIGFAVGILPNIKVWLEKYPWDKRVPPEWTAYVIDVPAAPVAAFLVGALVYYLFARLGLQSRVIPYGPALKQMS
jgi:cytosine permease